MKNNTTDEKKLIKKAQKGDTRAFDELIHNEKDRITKYSLKICGGNKDEAEEVSQLAVIKAWKHIEKFHMDCAFHTWFYKIARNLFYDMLRTRKNKRFYSLDQESWQKGREGGDGNWNTIGLGGVAADMHLDLHHSDGPRIFGYAIEDSEHLVSSRFPSGPDEAYAEEDFKKEAREISSRVLGKLSEDHRKILEMREFEEMAYCDIAERLKISEGTVMSRLYYARRNARKAASCTKKIP